MSPYAAKTTVPVSRSREEIERTLTRYGADAFGYGWDAGRQVITFRAHNRFIRFVVEIGTSPQQERQRWRALLLVIKAKLEAVESEIATFEEEFLGHVVLPDNQTVSEWLTPQIEAAYTDGRMPGSLLALPPGGER